MYTKRYDIKPFVHKVYLASPTMHGEKLNLRIGSSANNEKETDIFILQEIL